MAIIQASRTFEGSELTSNAFGKVLIDGIRSVSFREDKNKEGNFFFILPPYKVDRFGKGVSWKTLQVRDNFGIDVKERFAVAPNCPISFFANQVKLLFPDYAKVEKFSHEGKEMKRYPTYGRTVNRVIFNVAYFKGLELGAHILEVPQFGAGDKVEAYSRGKQPGGEDNPLINDYKAAYPVWFQLKKNAVGNPWEVTIEKSRAYALPESLADSDNLYNLDDVIYYPDPEYLIEKLRSITPVEIFEACMNGYYKNQHFKAASVAIAPQSVPQEVTNVSTLQPAFTPTNAVMPRAVIPGRTATQNAAPQSAPQPIPQESVQVGSNPVAMTKDQAREFITRKV